MFGFINMSGNLGAAIFPPVIGMLVANKNWNGVFIVSAAAFMIAFVLWCFVDPRVKLPAHVEA
jgi:sugar phosphate permease